MKKMLFLFVAVFFAYPAKPQLKQTVESEIAIPKFQGGTVVIRTIEATGYFEPMLTISDGSEVKFSLALQTLKPRNDGDNARTLATVIEQLKKQGYKLIGSNGGGGGGANAIIVTNYIFQRSEEK